jgi:hypothetical protein
MPRPSKCPLPSCMHFSPPSCVFHVSPISVLDFINLLVKNALLCNFIHPLVTYFLIGLNILSILLSNILNILSTLTVTKFQTIIKHEIKLWFFIFSSYVLGNRKEGKKFQTKW